MSSNKNNKKLLKLPEPLAVINETIRCIQTFPQPYLMNATPYNSYDFSPQITANGTRMPSVQIVKAVVVGDQAVGKSSLLQRFCYNTFKSDYKCTIGVDFEIELFQILNRLLKVQFWDTAGQERFKCIAASYYRGSKAVIVVFDMSSIQSLMNAKQWASEACLHASSCLSENSIFQKSANTIDNSKKTCSTLNDAANPANKKKFASNEKNEKREPCSSNGDAKRSEGSLLFLVGTKRDLVSDNTWKEVEALAITVAKEIHAELWIVSSLTGERVNDFFFRLATLLLENSMKTELLVKQVIRSEFATDMIKVDDDQPVKTQTNCCK